MQQGGPTKSGYCYRGASRGVLRGGNGDGSGRGCNNRGNRGNLTGVPLFPPGQNTNRGRLGISRLDQQPHSRPTTPNQGNWYDVQHMRAISLDRAYMPSLFLQPPAHYNYASLGDAHGHNYGEGSRRGINTARRATRGERYRGAARGESYRGAARGESYRGAGRGECFRGATRGEGSKDAGFRGRPRSDQSNMGFEKMKSFTEMEPDKLLVVLASENVGLDMLLKTNLTPDYIVLIVRVISKMCESNFQENKGRILASVCEKDFINKLNMYLSEIVLHDERDKCRNKFLWKEQDRFWIDLLRFYESVLATLPSTGADVLPKLVRHSILSLSNMEREQNVTISDETKENFNHLLKKVLMCADERERKKVEKYNDLSEEEPPDNFRLISLYPTASEITSRERPYIRKNIIDGAYKSVEHYLDVQFRLLREDFVAPLRDGVCDYISQQLTKERKRIFNVRVYQNVVFLKKHQVQDKMAVIVQMKMTQPRHKIKTENSRRFMFGSLMCFTRDNFRSVIFGTVCDRDATLLENGQVAVDIMDNFLYNCEYIMVECSVYFEPYYHVLHALRMMDADTFPLKRYLVDVVSEVDPPSYFKEFDQIEFNDFDFYPLNLHAWPSAEELDMDHSQYKAFQLAVTKEFCVIQGPPGTGKTYLGLKITQLLLENKSFWNRDNGPILVICFTNHALDQFLEGICRYTHDLVRVGGQSKSETLKTFNIREARSRFQRDRATNKVMFQQRQEIRNIMLKMKEYQAIVDVVTSFNQIIDFRHFNAIDEQYGGSWFNRARDSEIIDWLMRGRSHDERIDERQRNRMQEMQAQFQNVEVNDDESDDEYFDAEVNNERQVDDGDDIMIIKLTGHFVLNSVLVSVHSYQDKINHIAIDLDNLKLAMQEKNPYAIFDAIGAKQIELENTVEDLEYLKFRLDQYRTNSYPRKPHHFSYTNPSVLTHNERWGLYFHWLELYRARLNADISRLEARYRKSYREYEEVKQIEDIHLLREMDVVGMTTTGAARYQTILQNLKCPIVIVEEAAEVLEAHVVVSLSSGCKHLILIGDHQQLRPTTAEYHLAKNYNLEISLFERMLKNGIHCKQLEVQHRMRPEIASLIVPAIYPKLDNHRTVESYPPVLGVTKSLFFLSHNEPEETVGDSGSRRNVHEAQFLIKLARHFILQGYEPEDITILATYSGQMFCLLKERKSYPMLKDVRITVVDNFQGEESKLILLSLVRSNIEENIGFLKIDNRVCVALSRAKEGMYIMGNMDILQKSNNVWPKIKDVLERQGSLGSHLTLQCQIHPDQVTEVTKAEDFLKVSEGGCTKICMKELDCGHTCASMCHITDRTHSKYKCKEPCSKVLCEVGHICPQFCFETCEPCMVLMMVTLKCGHNIQIPCHVHDAQNHNCPTMIDVELECGHKATKPCHRNIATFPCPHACEVRQPCGHACIRNCHIHDDPDHLLTKCFKPCAKLRKNCSMKIHQCLEPCFVECAPCEVKVKKPRTICGHFYDIECSKDVDEIICMKPCKTVLDCGHKCPMKCFEDCGNCKHPVMKKIESCGHTIRAKCSEIPTTRNCKGNCPKLLKCGHKCNNKCCDECTTRCEYFVDNTHEVACNHVFKIPCYKTENTYAANDNELLRHCTEKCTVQLLCEHLCSGTCGECVQGRIHKSCQKDCGSTLICGHPCNIPCRNTCQPCNKKCEYRCIHSKCGKKCGEPCTSCTEPCTRRCDHIRCTNTCGQQCNVEPCNEPCQIRLKCNHPCLGFCGDPCPPICRVCDPKNDAFEIFFGDEDEEDARFVWLEDCGHSIEANGMDQWLMEDKSGEVNVKCCPRCKTSINKTQRFSDYVKSSYKDIIAIKHKWFGNKMENDAKRIQLQIRVTEIAHKNVKIYLESKYLRLILIDMQFAIKPLAKGRRNVLNNSLLDIYTAQVQIMERLCQIYTKSELDNNEPSKQYCIHIIDGLLRSIKEQNNRITEQEIEDFTLEVNRFEKLVQLRKIQINPQFTSAVKQPKIKSLFDETSDALNSIERFTEQNEIEMKQNLNVLRKMVDEAMVFSEEDRLMVVRAMDLGKGHWFKCPNGHYYAIGDCGGAMVVSKCIECKADIGGTSHSLLQTNRFAGEMDGASHAAWSEAANMMNYELR